MISPKPQRPEAKLLALLSEMQTLGSVDSLLAWDQETYMPPAGSHRRAETRSLISAMIHRLRVAPEMAAVLRSLSKSRNISPRMAAVVRKAGRDYRIAVRLPENHVREMARLASATQQVWARARQHNNFRMVAPWLEKIVRLKQRECEYLGYPEHPYDALLDLYEPHLRTARVREIFAELHEHLVPMVRTLAGRKASPAPVILKPVNRDEEESLRTFCRELLTDMGFDFARGRGDTSEHPFAIGLHPDDVRFTQRRHPVSCLDNIFSTLHEGGHALYEQGLSSQWPGTALAEAASMAMHESQSRLWENHVGRSPGFWTAYLPRLRRKLPRLLANITPASWLAEINRVRPSLIRVDADEITYNLHIMLRFELEMDLISGKLPVRKLPEIWKRKSIELFGIKPHNDAHGCLQDVHWFGGEFGYFPSYTLGNLYAAQFYETFLENHPSWPNELSRGKLGSLKTWLNRQVHRHGARYPTEELLIRVTGQGLSVVPFLKYLQEKY